MFNAKQAKRTAINSDSVHSSAAVGSFFNMKMQSSSDYQTVTKATVVL